jgi:hypothetical protein
MKIPCVVIVIPALTSSNMIEPEYMVPIYAEIHRNRLAAEQKAISTEAYKDPVFRHIESIAEEKAHLAKLHEFSSMSGQPLFDKVYPGDTFEKAVEAILVIAAKKELTAKKPVDAHADADLVAILGDRHLVVAIHALGVKNLEGTASLTLGKLCEIPNMSPGSASNILTSLAAARADDVAAKALAESTPKVEDPKAAKAK